MHIAILDHEQDRAIIAEVPEYLTELDRSSDDIASAILTALGLSVTYTEYMIGNFTLRIDVNSLNSGRGYGDNTGRLEEFTQNFKEDVLSALKDSE